MKETNPGKSLRIRAFDPNQFRKIFIDDQLHFDLSGYNPSQYQGKISQLSPSEIQLLFDLVRIDYDLPAKIDLKGHKFIRRVIETTNERFNASIDKKPTQKTILCGSTSNVDNVSYLKNDSAQAKIDKALENAITEGAELGKSRDDVIKEITDIIDEQNPDNLPGNINTHKINEKNFINTKAEVLGYILRMFTKKGSRIQLGDLEGRPGSSLTLGKWIDDTFYKEVSKVGGAAAQIGDFLNGIGEKKVVIYSKHLSKTQAEAFNNDPLFLKFKNGSSEIIIENKTSAGKEDDPTKINHIVERSEAIIIDFNKGYKGARQIKSTNEADRYIFLSPMTDREGKEIPVSPILDFNDDQLKRIGTVFNYFFTTTPSYLQRCKPEDYSTYSQILAKQFDIINQEGITKIIYEFSGNTSNIDFLNDVVKGRVASFSLNDDELNELAIKAQEKGFINLLTENNDNRPNELAKKIKVLDPITGYNKLESSNNLEKKVDKSNVPLSTFNKALAVAKWLQVERLHVHGLNIDIAIRKNPKNGNSTMEQERDSLSHGKQRVIEWIKGQLSVEHTSVENRVSKFLKVEGFRQLFKLAAGLAEQTTVLESTIIYDFLTNGFCQIDKDYWLAAIPTKWLYDKAKRTTSSGDVIASVAAVQALN